MTSVMASARSCVDRCSLRCRGDDPPRRRRGTRGDRAGRCGRVGRRRHAVDAAVTMMLVSCAAETIFTGLGGGGFATVYDAEPAIAPASTSSSACPGWGAAARDAGVPIEVIFVGQAMPYEIGPPTVAVPGVPAGAYHLWRRWGRLPWADVVAPGRLASSGHSLPGRPCRTAAAGGTGLSGRRRGGGLRAAGWIAAAGRRPVAAPRSPERVRPAGRGPGRFLPRGVRRRRCGRGGRSGALDPTTWSRTAWSSPRRGRRPSADSACSPAATTSTTSSPRWRRRPR